MVGLLHPIRRIEEYYVGDDMLPLQAPKDSGKILPQNSVSFRDFQAVQVLLDHLLRHERRSPRKDLLGAAAKRFDPHRSRAGKQIQPYAALECLRIAGGEHVEQRLAQPIGSGTNILPANERRGRPRYLPAITRMALYLRVPQPIYPTM